MAMAVLLPFFEGSQAECYIATPSDMRQPLIWPFGESTVEQNSVTTLCNLVKHGHSEYSLNRWPSNDNVFLEPASAV